MSEIRKSWYLIKESDFEEQDEIIVDNLGSDKYKIIIRDLIINPSYFNSSLRCQAKFGNNYITTNYYWFTHYFLTSTGQTTYHYGTSSGREEASEESKNGVFYELRRLKEGGGITKDTSYLEIDILPNQQNVKMLKCYLQTFIEESKGSNSMYEVNSSCSILGNGGTFSGIKIYNSGNSKFTGHLELYTFIQSSQPGNL